MTAVLLRPTHPDEIACCMAAERDPEARQFVGESTADEHRARIDGPGDHLIIEAGGVPAGFMILDAMNDWRAVELSRLVITGRGRGVGRIALPLAVDRVFEATAVHRFWLDLLPRNERAHRAYLRAGFVDEGVLRDGWIGPAGNFESLLIMSILRPDWEASRGALTGD